MLLFWLSVFVVVYTYFGYPLLLWLFSLIRPAKKIYSQNPPAVSVVIPAYNEEKYIVRKIENTLAFDYPADLLEIIVITDGSTDSTFTRASTYQKIKVLNAPERMGKAAAINRAVPFTKGEILVFTDANTFLQPSALRWLMAPFADEETGGVSGEKKVIETAKNATLAGEGIYWQYESWLKKNESRFYSVVGAAGELFAIRKNLFVPIPPGTITDDFYLSVSVNLQQKKVAYVPEAVAMEEASLSFHDEWKRKIRIAAGGFQSLLLLPGALNFFKRPALAFQFFSHRVLRWFFCAPALLLMFCCNILLVYRQQDGFYTVLLISQLCFYMLALTGWLFSSKKKSHFIFSIPFYFLMMHVAMLVGFYRLVSGRQSVLWEKANR